jgi:pimeloyl-ACP methyl ester carboxylesterase
MKLRRAAAYLGAGLGLAAVANRGLRSAAGALEPPLDGRQRTLRWRGMDVAYTEAGDPDDPTLVCLHGINAAGSSGEFRAVFDDLAADFHVVAPDLPGFGRSDRPPLRYSAALYEDFVGDFLARYDPLAGAAGTDADAGDADADANDAHDGRPPIVLASSLTAAYVAGVADDVAIDRLLTICPTAIGGPEPQQAWLRELLRAPLVGELLFNLLASKPSIRYFNADHGYYDVSKVTDEWMDYEWRTAHQPGARFAPASFVSGGLNSDVDLAAALADLDAPVTIYWGREAEITPLADGRDLAEAADARLVVFDDARLLPHVEFPVAFVDAVRVATDDESAPAPGVDGDRDVATDRDAGVTTER